MNLYSRIQYIDNTIHHNSSQFITFHYCLSLFINYHCLSLLHTFPSCPKLRDKTSAPCRIGSGPSSASPCKAAKKRTSPLLRPQATNQGDTATVESSWAPVSETAMMGFHDGFPYVSNICSNCSEWFWLFLIWFICTGLSIGGYIKDILGLRTFCRTGAMGRHNIAQRQSKCW